MKAIDLEMKRVAEKLAGNEKLKNFLKTATRTRWTRP